jgi:hypothetical protein
MILTVLYKYFVHIFSEDNNNLNKQYIIYNMQAVNYLRT